MFQFFTDIESTRKNKGFNFVLSWKLLKEQGTTGRTNFTKVQFAMNYVYEKSLHRWCLRSAAQKNDLGQTDYQSAFGLEVGG